MFNKLTFAKITVFTLVLMVSAPVLATFAETEDPSLTPDEYQELLEKGRKYIAMRSGSRLYVFDINAAIAAGEDQAFIERGIKFNELNEYMEKITIMGNMELQATPPFSLPGNLGERLGKFQKYISTPDDNITLPVFDVDAAVAAGEDEELVEMGRMFNQVSRGFHEEALDRGAKLFADEERQRLTLEQAERAAEMLAERQRLIREQAEREVKMFAEKQALMQEREETEAPPLDEKQSLVPEQTERESRILAEEKRFIQERTEIETEPLEKKQENNSVFYITITVMALILIFFITKKRWF